MTGTSAERSAMKTFIDGSNTSLNPGKIRQVDKATKISHKVRPPTKPIFTSTKHSMAYFTVSGIESETSYLQPDWPRFALKELMDNPFDWLNDYYEDSPKDHRKIAVRIWWQTNNIIRISVRNSNVDNIPVFESLEATFDYGQWYSSKRHQHRMTCGSLGDALKRILGMGYASWTSSSCRPEDSFEDLQWDEPIILRFNGQQVRGLLRLDRDNQQARVTFVRAYNNDIGNDTQVEVALPVDDRRNEGLYDALIGYYKIYKVAKSRTDFSLDISRPI